MPVGVPGLSSGSSTSSAASPLVTSSSQDSKREKSTQNRTEDRLEETWSRLLSQQGVTTKHEETRCAICQNVWRSSLKTSCTGKLQQQKQSTVGSLSKEGTHTTLLYGSRTTVASCGRVHTVKLGLDHFSCSSDKRSRNIHPRPEPSTSATRTAEQKTLKANAVVRPCLCSVQDKVNDLLADGVVSACEVSAASSFLEAGCCVVFKNNSKVLSLGSSRQAECRVRVGATPNKRCRRG